MPAINERNRNRRGESRNSIEARRISYKISASILCEKANKEKYSMPIQKAKGPRQQIIDYVDIMENLGMRVSDEDIIEFMQKRMTNLDREYIQNLIDQVRVPTIIAYYKYRSGIASRVIEDIVKKYPGIDSQKVEKTIQKYRINPNFLTKNEKAQVDEALKKIVAAADKLNSRDDGEDR